MPDTVCPFFNASTPGVGNLTAPGNSSGGGSNGTVVGGATPTPSVFVGEGGLRRMGMGMGMGGLVVVVGVGLGLL